jgi:hypothetical protein
MGMHKAFGWVVLVAVQLALAGCPGEGDAPAADGGAPGVDAAVARDSSTPDPDSGVQPPQDSGVEVDASMASIDTPPDGVTLSIDGVLVTDLHPYHQLLSASAIAKRIIYNHTEYQIAMDDYTVSLDIAFVDGSTPPYSAAQVKPNGTSLSVLLNDESNFDPPPAIRSTNVRKTYKPVSLPSFAFANAPGRFAGSIEGDFAAEEDGEMIDAKITFNFADE